MTEFVFNQIRVQIISKDIVRVEQSKKCVFCDENTYFIPGKPVSREVNATAFVDDCGNHVVNFDDIAITIPANGDSMRGVTLSIGGNVEYKYKRAVNSGELPALEKTPKVYAVYDNPRVLMPNKGYCVGAKYTVRENVDDVYLLICRNNHKMLRQLYVDLTGRTEMVRLSTLGFWNSRYFEHSDQSARQLLLDYAAHDVPLDNMVLDTDWRKASDRGIGYEINETLFPDMKSFYKFAHSKGVEIMFNDHPEPLEGAKSLLDRKEIKYREQNLKRHLKMGLDYWWYDRNWHTRLISPTKHVHPESFGSYLFADITKQYFQSKGSEQIYRRPVIMSNVDNISNGDYRGINDTASHRYSIQWTGDITSDESSIAVEIQNMLLAQNSCVTYVNSDCGGHTGNPTKEEFIRWMQFGAFSPIFRPHCTKGVARFREPWAYDDETLAISRQYVKMRYRLLASIYKNAHESYLTGQPLFKPLSYDNIEDTKTHKIVDEYMLGENILIAPLHGVMPKKVGYNCYCNEVTATYYDGIECKGKPICNATYSKLDMHLNHTSPEKDVPMYNFSAIFETRLCFNKDVELIVESDDGATVEVDGVVTLEDNNFHSATKMKAGLLKGGEIHHVKIRYFQGGGEAALSLWYNEVDSKHNINAREVYLPQGVWVDVFSGTEYVGGRKYVRKCEYNEMPLYVRKGAAIPLLKCAQTTKKQNWADLTFDLYPSKETSVSDYLYEDDQTTTAYKQGIFRKSPFKTHFDEQSNAVCLTLSPAEGEYNDDIGCRTITVKYHLLKGADKVRQVTVNGKVVKFEIQKVDKDVYPLETQLSACDTKTLTLTFSHDVTQQTEVKFLLK